MRGGSVATVAAVRPAPHPPSDKRQRHTHLRRLIYAVFFAWVLVRYGGAPGDDLSSSYIGCRVIAEGKSAHLYDFNAVLFHVVDSAAWIATAAKARFNGFLHPYVQTPLWAWSLQPLCTNLSFRTFSFLFIAMNTVSLCILIETVARYWAPMFLLPLPLAALLSVTSLTTPFEYAMFLVQTHPIFLALAIGAIVAEERGKSRAAAGALALAAAVKITPGMLVLYWLMRGRYRAVAWFVGLSFALMAATILAVGPLTMIDYLKSLYRISNILLVSFNNQSLAAWLAYNDAMRAELETWRILPLSAGLKAISVIASVGVVGMAGWLSRSRRQHCVTATLALVALTAGSPIAWTHYWLVLIPASMVLLQYGGVAGAGAVAVVALLNVVPFAVDPLAPQLTTVSFVRGHLGAGIIAMAALAALARTPAHDAAADREQVTLSIDDGTDRRATEWNA
jgi:hypothetical protein